jgi:hypothetical protein
MKAWKIAISIIGGVAIMLILMNIITRSGNTLHGGISGVGLIDKSIFYEGITIIVVSIVMSCVVMIICTLNIIKAINSNNRNG